MHHTGGHSIFVGGEKLRLVGARRSHQGACLFRFILALVSTGAFASAESLARENRSKDGRIEEDAASGPRPEL